MNDYKKRLENLEIKISGNTQQTIPFAFVFPDGAIEIHNGAIKEYFKNKTDFLEKNNIPIEKFVKIEIISN